MPLLDQKSRTKNGVTVVVRRYSSRCPACGWDRGDLKEHQAAHLRACGKSCPCAGETT